MHIPIQESPRRSIIAAFLLVESPEIAEVRARMGRCGDSVMVVALAVAFSCSMMMESADAMLHVVGGREGWDVPDNLTFYEDWARPRTFGASDQLIFPFRLGPNNVMEVSGKDYETCNTVSPIEMHYEAPLILNLTKTGDYYYLSSIGKHCEFGQKLHITVVNAKGSSGKEFPFDFGFIENITPAPAPAPIVNTDHKASSGLSLRFGGICGALGLLVSMFA
ncbi:hypothetical protein MLD38_023732 [Melastoma candidum]|uniref:Uncharacterized protein n=1 Tax=Melastoma candidum TaxID=119954 RepID=A0ACB9NR13_9MYRT|nr:hypothetical protein MLD38_023732 [Melastoma candidum]